jgi:hypothetical protein
MQKAIQALFLSSVAGLALLGAVAILGQTSRLLLAGVQTAGVVAIVAGLSMGALRAWQRGRVRPVAVLTMLAGAAIMVLVLPRIWAHGDLEGDALAVAGVIAVSGGLICAVAIADLLPRFLWVRVLTVSAVAVTGGFAVYTLATHDVPGEFGTRLWGLTAILAASGVVVTPILHGATQRLLRPDHDDPPSLVRCPHCGHKLPSDVTEVF